MLIDSMAFYEPMGMLCIEHILCMDHTNHYRALKACKLCSCMLYMFIKHALCLDLYCMNELDCIVRILLFCFCFVTTKHLYLSLSLYLQS